jgi:hypothetical protein
MYSTIILEKYSRKILKKLDKKMNYLNSSFSNSR